MKAKLILGAGLAMVLFIAGCEQSPWKTEDFDEKDAITQFELYIKERGYIDCIKC